MRRALWLLPLLLLAGTTAHAQERLIGAFRVIRACAGDVERLCGDVLPGEGRIKACMKAKVGQVSAECLDTMLEQAAAGRESAETQPVPVPANPEPMTYPDLRGVIYCEVWLFRLTPEEQIAGVYYNTSAMNNAADPKNTCPASLWDKITVPSLEAQYDVLAAYKNGPRGWTMDSITLPVGPVVTFDGLGTRWMGQGLLPKGMSLAAAHMAPYKPLQSHRKSSMTFGKGKPVFILDDPEGTPWVMQAFGQIIDKTLTYETLKDLGSKLKPPPGWKFRVAVPEQDLIVSTPQGYNWIVQDELQNTYDACKEGACNIKP
ncbi:MAG: hypothetical protein U1E53_32865 [Dongiaceae bacterium]